MKLIPLTRGKVALVDDADFEAVNAFKWYADKKRSTYYAARNIVKANGKLGVQYMHQFLMPGVAQVDHRFGDGLDNQREHIRPATNQQNRRGFSQPRPGASSRFRGCHLETRRKLKWVAQIRVDGKQISLGQFNLEEDAARAYNEAALKYFGDFAQLNTFPKAT